MPPRTPANQGAPPSRLGNDHSVMVSHGNAADDWAACVQQHQVEVVLYRCRLPVASSILTILMFSAVL